MAGIAQVDTTMSTDASGLTARWTLLRHHAVQDAWNHSTARFTVVPAGRRSGKTELAKRRAVIRALRQTRHADAWYVLGAPTINQARRIFWRDLKAMIPRELRDGKPRESDLTIRLINGAEITVMGMEEPARVEGRPLDGIVLDEYANMKAGAWGENIRPALADRQGWADLIGVPEGRNHYYQMYQAACADKSGEWAGFTWKSADILPASEIESARRDLDPLTFAQEFEASFLNFEGRAYYPYARDLHSLHGLRYQPDLPLIFCFDFNTSPGVAVVCQEQEYARHSPIRHAKLVDRMPATGTFTAVIGEVWIPSGSNSERIAQQLCEKWGHHQREVFLDGDATGGAKGSAKVAGSDWEIIRRVLARTFTGRVKPRYPKANPKERVRVNSLNSRLMAVDGTIRMLINPDTCPHLINDLEGVSVVEGGAGEIDKKQGADLTHISDALGYYVVRRWPVDGGVRLATEVVI